MLKKGVTAIDKGLQVSVKPGNPVWLILINSKGYLDKIPVVWTMSIFDFLYVYGPHGVHPQFMLLACRGAPITTQAPQ
jgi:hypothetical protein